MMLDLTPAPANAKRFRRDWGTQNMIGLSPPPLQPKFPNAEVQRRVHAKIARFIGNAVWPQQVTVPRQYATTREGCWVYKILEGRELRMGSNGARYREKGVRVVVQENAQQARFVMSPLFGSRHDALAWAQREMGAQV